jgi:chromosome segregation ATPase
MNTAMNTHLRSDPEQQHSGRTALSITQVVPPAPHYGGGTYDVRLELPRPLSVHERRALPRLARRVPPVGRQMILCDTTLERVRERVGELTRLIEEVEAQGRHLELEREECAQAHAITIHEERNRLVSLARSIRFDQKDGAGPRDP